MYKNILLAVDLGDEGSWDKALPEALNLVNATNGVLHVITVIPDYGMTIVGSFFPQDYEQKALAATTDKLHAFTAAHIPSDVKVQHIICHGKPAEEILKAAKEGGSDIVVIGSKQPGFDHSFFGSVASRVVAHAHCSVLVVRP